MLAGAATPRSASASTTARSQACGDAATCELWLVGEWKDGVFNVTKVDGKPSGLERSAGHTARVWLREG